MAPPFPINAYFLSVGYWDGQYSVPVTVLKVLSPLMLSDMLKEWVSHWTCNIWWALRHWTLIYKVCIYISSKYLSRINVGVCFGGFLPLLFMLFFLLQRITVDRWDLIFI